MGSVYWIGTWSFFVPSDLQNLRTAETASVSKLYSDLLVLLKRPQSTATLLKNLRTKPEYRVWPSRVFQEALHELARINLTASFHSNGMWWWQRGSADPWQVLPVYGNIWKEEPEVEETLASGR